MRKNTGCWWLAILTKNSWPAGATGHLELLDAWCDHMRDSLPNSRAFTRAFFGTEGAFWPVCTVAGFTQVPCWYTMQFAWSHTGFLAWLVWLRWITRGQFRLANTASAA